MHECEALDELGDALPSPIPGLHAGAGDAQQESLALLATGRESFGVDDEWAVEWASRRHRRRDGVVLHARYEDVRRRERQREAMQELFRRRPIGERRVIEYARDDRGPAHDFREGDRDERPRPPPDEIHVGASLAQHRAQRRRDLHLEAELIEESEILRIEADALEYRTVAAFRAAKKHRGRPSRCNGCHSSMEPLSRGHGRSRRAPNDSAGFKSRAVSQPSSATARTGAPGLVDPTNARPATKRSRGGCSASLRTRARRRDLVRRRKPQCRTFGTRRRVGNGMRTGRPCEYISRSRD